MINPSSKPGYQTAKTFTPRLIRRNSMPVYLDGGVPINAAYSGDASNTSNVDVLRPGTVMCKQSSGGKYRNWIWGKSTAAYADNDTTITVGAATATEIARIKAAAGGGNLTALFVGPPTAAGTVAATAITITAVGATTITVGDLNLNKVTDSLICCDDQIDGSFCLMDNDDHIKLTDDQNTRVDQLFERPLIGGTIDVSQIVHWPADTATQAYLLAKLNATGGIGNYRFDQFID